MVNVYNFENCSIEHDGSYGNTLKTKPKNGMSIYRFCSMKCAKSFSTKSDRNTINKKYPKK